LQPQVIHQQAPQPNTPNFSTAPNPGATPNHKSHSPNIDPSYRHDSGADMLVGGIIGYLIGRRRGRIKTEARLLPVQEKLEAEVKSLQDKIATSEDHIRTATREQFWAKKPENRHIFVEKLQNSQRNPETAVSAPEKQSAPQRTPESYGKIVVENIAEFPAPRSENVPRTSEKLPKAELLSVAERIEVSGTSLRRMYETNAIDEEGLRKVVDAYVRGDQYKEVLAREIMGQETRGEKSVERDKDASFRSHDQAGRSQQTAQAEQAASTLRTLTDEEMPAPLIKPKKNTEVRHILHQNPRVWVAVVLAIAIILVILLLK